MYLNTGNLSTTPNVSAAVTPGVAVAGPDQIARERFALRFEARAVSPTDPSDVVALPSSGTTLNAVVVNNNAIVLALAVHDGTATVTCEPAHGVITLAYTAYHPELGGVHLTVAPNVGAAALDIAPFSNTDVGVNQDADPTVAIPASPGLHKCGYIVTLSASARQHDGTNAFGYSQTQQTFYYDPTP
jgi:hypothetical protein